MTAKAVTRRGSTPMSKTGDLEAASAGELRLDLGAESGPITHEGGHRMKAAWLRTGAVYVAGLVITVGLWELVSVVGGFGAYVLPTPGDVARAFTSREASVLWPNLLVTFEEVLIGLAGALVVGVALALAVNASTVARRIVNPLLAATQAVPKIAIAPIFVIWFGLGTLPRDIMAALLAVFPITISTLVGLESLDNDLRLLVRASGSTPIRSFRLVRLPAALPNFLGGVKVGVTLAVTGAILSEFIGGNTGVGYVITTAQGQVQTSLAFAGIIVVSLLGILLFWAVEIVESFVLRSRR